MMDQISICEALVKRNEIHPFLKRRVIEDEKWLTYDNIVRKRSWSKCGEAAQTGQTLNSDIYCQQLDRLKLVADHKGPELANRRSAVFHQDNAMPVVTRHKPWELGWKVLMHPPYSPNLAPNVYHLFFALQNFQSD
ncbi:histone-lysine N-methyltransferase SETMAR [Trichonephila clavipes]|nr:histone-lysine N-methyltransferase SETMAR [Trichonephila clavipes]